MMVHAVVVRGVMVQSVGTDTCIGIVHWHRPGAACEGSALFQEQPTDSLSLPEDPEVTPSGPATSAVTALCVSCGGAGGGGGAAARTKWERQAYGPDYDHAGFCLHALRYDFPLQQSGGQQLLTLRVRPPSWVSVP